MATLASMSAATPLDWAEVLRVSGETRRCLCLAIDTGFRQGANELWSVPDDDAFVFIRYPEEGRVEAWPKESGTIGCL